MKRRRGQGIRGSRTSRLTQARFSLATIRVAHEASYVSRETFPAATLGLGHVSRETSKERTFRRNTSSPWVESGGLRHLRDDLVGGINTDTGTFA